MKQCKLPQKKQNEFLQFLENVQDNPTANKQDMNQFFHLLSPSLRLSSHKFINSKIFNAPNSLLNNINQSELSLIVTHMMIQIY